MVAPHRPYSAPPEGYSGPKRALILAGGGMRVAYQAGAIRALLEEGLRFSLADGTSGGTMNLGMLLSGLAPVDMCDRWRTLDVHQFVSFVPLWDYAKAWDLPAMGTAAGLVDGVFPHLGIDAEQIRAAEGLQATFNVCNFTRKTNEAIPHTAIDRDLLVAGVSLPILLPPVAHGDALYMDSVWIKDANLMAAVKAGADELWVVWCIGNSPQYRPGIFNQYVHMIEISANGGLFEEFDRIAEINARIRSGEAVYGHTQPIQLHVLKPEYPLPLDPEFYAGHIDAATLIDMGYADGKRYLRARPEAGLPFDPAATRMTDNRLGATFRESLSGYFALGETDPASGAHKGEAAQTTLALHVAVHIHDLPAFSADAQHTAGLTGHFTFPGFGDNIPATGGLFNLFAPAEAPDSKAVFYELAFQHEGQDYCFSGQKRLPDAPGADLLGGATTLLVQLHQGRDAGGPVVGAGILRLSLEGLAQVVSTMHVTDAPSLAEGATALLRFGRFFLGDLWAKHGG